NREQQKSTAEGRKCGQLFSVEREVRAFRRNRAAPEHSRKGAMPPAARGLISSTTLIADGCRPRTDEVSDHLGFRAIHKMGNIRFLSRVIWGNAAPPPSCSTGKSWLHFRPPPVDFCSSRLAIGAATERARALAMAARTRAKALQTRL